MHRPGAAPIKYTVFLVSCIYTPPKDRPATPHDTDLSTRCSTCRRPALPNMTTFPLGNRNGVMTLPNRVITNTLPHLSGTIAPICGSTPGHSLQSEHLFQRACRQQGIGPVIQLFRRVLRKAHPGFGVQRPSAYCATSSTPPSASKPWPTRYTNQPKACIECFRPAAGP